MDGWLWTAESQCYSNDASAIRRRWAFGRQRSWTFRMMNIGKHSLANEIRTWQCVYPQNANSWMPKWWSRSAWASTAQLDDLNDSNSIWSQTIRSTCPNSLAVSTVVHHTVRGARRWRIKKLIGNRWGSFNSCLKDKNVNNFAKWFGCSLNGIDTIRRQKAGWAQPPGVLLSVSFTRKTAKQWEQLSVGSSREDLFECINHNYEC